MAEEIFRKKSLDRIQSPEALNDYVRVCNPGVWLLLAALILLLIGAGVWSVFGHLDTTVPAEVVAEGGSAVCYIDSADAEDVQAGMPVHVDDAEGTLGQMLNLSDRADTERFAVSIDLPDGVYAAEVVTDSRKPINFVLN